MSLDYLRGLAGKVTKLGSETVRASTPRTTAARSTWLAPPTRLPKADAM